jgi:hypothetical protein
MLAVIGGGQRATLVLESLDADSVSVFWGGNQVEGIEGGLEFVLSPQDRSQSLVVMFGNRVLLDTMLVASAGAELSYDLSPKLTTRYPVVVEARQGEPFLDIAIDSVWGVYHESVEFELHAAFKASLLQNQVLKVKALMYELNDWDTCIVATDDSFFADGKVTELGQLMAQESVVSPFLYSDFQDVRLKMPYPYMYRYRVVAVDGTVRREENSSLSGSPIGYRGQPCFLISIGVTGDSTSTPFQWLCFESIE